MNWCDPFVIVGMEDRDDAEAHEAMLTVDLGAWLAENPNEYPFSTSKLAEKLVRIGWRQVDRGQNAASRPTRDEVRAALVFAAPDYLKVEDLRKMADAVGALRGWRE